MGKVGDRLIVMAFGQFSPEEAAVHAPKVVFLDERNNPAPQLRTSAGTSA